MAYYVQEHDVTWVQNGLGIFWKCGLFLSSEPKLPSLSIHSNRKIIAQNILLFLNSVVLIHTLKNRKTIALLFFKIHRTAVLVLFFYLLWWHWNFQKWPHPVFYVLIFMLLYSTLERFKGTQAWEFFGLRFWNLYFFVVSYAEMLRFCLKKKFGWTIIGGDRIVLRIPSVLLTSACSTCQREKV